MSLKISLGTIELLTTKPFTMHYAPKLRLTNSIAILLFVFLSNVSFTQSYQDCDSAFPVCNKQTYHFESMNGFGNILDNIGLVSCSKELRETNSIWLKFSVESSGILTFLIDPIIETDDIDFILYKKNETDCINLKEVRCMASGETIGETETINIGCKGATGLSYQSIDEFERSGCKFYSDNFLKYLKTEKDEEYFLFINNYNSKSGFSIFFDGDLEFKNISNCAEYIKEEPITITSIIPNPAQKFIDVDFTSFFEHPLVLEIFSLNGRLEINQIIYPKKGNQVHRISIDELTTSNYLLRLTQEKYSTIRQFSKI